MAFENELPAGSEQYSNQLYKDGDGNIWTGNPFDESYRRVVESSTLNDSLTDATTSADLDIIYPGANIGDQVRSETGGWLWIKAATGLWNRYPLSQGFSQDFGVNENGTSGGDNPGNAGMVKANDPDSLCTVDGVVSKLFVEIESAGTFYVSIGTPGAIFRIRKTLPVFTASATGWQEFSINEPIFKGEVCGIGGASGGTASIRYKTSGHPPTRYAQFRTNLSTQYGPAGSYYAMYYEVVWEESKLLDVYLAKPRLQSDLATYMDEEQLSDDVFAVGFGTDGGTVLPGIATNEYLAIGIPAPYNAKVPKVSLRRVNAGNTTFSIGLLDQFGIWIEDRTFTVPLPAGLGSFDPNEYLLQGQQIAIKTPIGDIHTQAGGSYWRSDGDGYSEPLVETSGTSLSFEYELRELSEHAVVGREEFNDVKSEINELKQEKPVVVRSTPGGVKYRLVCDDDGSNLRTESLYPSNVLVLGNSITVHPVTSFWWGVWGMAASEREKDFVHVLESLLQAVNPGATVTPLNIAAFEVNHGTYDFSQLDAHLAGKDETIIRLGENVSNLVGWQDSLESLVDYIRSIVPSMRVAITGVFWANSAKDSAQEGAASAKGIPFVPLSDLDTPANRSYMGAQVYGDDSQWHTVNNSGVAAHPGDGGMQGIGERLYNSLYS